MKFQCIQFQREKDSKWEDGIAKLQAFDVFAIDFIVDGDGNKIDGVWNYRLIPGPCKYIDTNYY